MPVGHGAELRSPTRLGHARDQALGGALPKRDAGKAKTTDEGAPTAARLTTVHQAGWARVARQLGKAFIIAFRLQLGAHGGVLLHRPLLALVPFDPAFLGHNESVERTANAGTRNRKPWLTAGRRPSMVSAAGITPVPAWRRVMSLAVPDHTAGGGRSPQCDATILGGVPFAVCDLRCAQRLNVRPRTRRTDP